MKFTLTTTEILEWNWPVHRHGQLILSLLQQKGAPVKGTTWLTVKPGYQVFFHLDEESRSYHYEFVAIDLSAGPAHGVH